MNLLHARVTPSHEELCSVQFISVSEPFLNISLRRAFYMSVATVRKHFMAAHKTFHGSTQNKSTNKHLRCYIQPIFHFPFFIFKTPQLSD